MYDEAAGGAGNNALWKAVHQVILRGGPSAFDKTRDPLPTDDIAAGWFPGSLWRATGKLLIWMCVDNTAGNARWLPIAGTKVSPRTFGAYGDGNNDDLAALNACLAYTQANRVGMIDMGSGIYRITDAWLFNQVLGLTVQGAGGTGALQSGGTAQGYTDFKDNFGQYRSGTRILLDAPVAGRYLLDVYGSSHLHFRDMTFYGQASFNSNPATRAAAIVRLRNKAGYGTLHNVWDHIGAGYGAIGFQFGAGTDTNESTCSDERFFACEIAGCATGIDVKTQQGLNYYLYGTDFYNNTTAINFEYGGCLRWFGGEIHDNPTIVRVTGGSTGGYDFTLQGLRMEDGSGGTDPFAVSQVLFDSSAAVSGPTADVVGLQVDGLTIVNNIGNTTNPVFNLGPRTRAKVSNCFLGTRFLAKMRGTLINRCSLSFKDSTFQDAQTVASRIDDDQFSHWESRNIVYRGGFGKADECKWPGKVDYSPPKMVALKTNPYSLFGLGRQQYELTDTARSEWIFGYPSAGFMREGCQWGQPSLVFDAEGSVKLDGSALAYGQLSTSIFGPAVGSNGWTNQSVTYGVWFKATSFANAAGIGIRRTLLGNRRGPVVGSTTETDFGGFELYIDPATSKLTLEIGVYSGTISVGTYVTLAHPTVLNLNQTYFGAFSRRGSDGQIAVTLATAAGSISTVTVAGLARVGPTGNDLGIGRNFYNGNSFVGWLDDILMYDSYKVAADLQPVTDVCFRGYP